MAQQRSGQLKTVLEQVIRLHTTEEGFQWLTDKAPNAGQLPGRFAAVPRKTGKKVITLTQDQREAIDTAHKGWDINEWTVDRLARVWLLMALDSSDKQRYVDTIEPLFRSAEVNELVALYSSLPVLEYPETWVARCSEGIRSNIGDVLTAIMCGNPYPSQYLDEAAWNQLVLKAFFTEKPIGRIVGLDLRANEKLAATLYDYAHERLSAHRTVDPELWRCIEPFISETTIPDYHQIKEYVLQS